MQQTEKVMDEPTECDGFKIAYAFRDIGNTVVLPLDMLEPIDKIREPTFYEYVAKSFKANGLLYPLVVHPLTEDEWEKEMELDKDQLPPQEPGTYLRYRIQCGCNRYYLLKSLGYDAVECAVVDRLEDSWELCKKLRNDKTWKRGRFNSKWNPI